MYRKFVTARNVTPEAITIRDRRFSHGVLTIEAGAEYGLPNDIWMDHRRRYTGKLVDTSTLVPVAEVIAFTPTHMLRDEAVMLVKTGAKRVYFDKADGSNSWATIEDWAAEAVEIAASTESEETSNENA